MYPCDRCWPSFTWNAQELAQAPAAIPRALIRAEETLAAVTAKVRIWEFVNRQPITDRQRLIINRLRDGFEGHLTTLDYAKIRVLVQNEGGGRGMSCRIARADELAAN